MKILIYGSRGWIGNQFTNFLDSVEEDINYIRGSSRVDNTEALKAEIGLVRPSHIISFIGRTHGYIGDKEYSTIDYLEQNGKLVENIRDNLFSPISLALICEKENIHLTYLGTGCIFNQDTFTDKVIGFTEKSEPNFFGSSYSVVKGFTDRLMHQLEDTTLNLRIRMPITGEENPRNFITKITNYAKICSIPNSMTVLPDFYPVILDLMRKGEKGTLNLTNPGLISHNEILDEYRRIVDNTFTYQNFTLEEQSVILDSARSNNFLNTEKLESEYPDIPNIKDSVRFILENYKKKT